MSGRENVRSLKIQGVGAFVSGSIASAAGSGAGGVEWARAYVAAAGCHHLEINGQVPAPDLRGICPWPVGLADGGHAQEGGT